MILILGPPGSGKGIQSRLLAQKINYKIFALGELLRSEIVNKTANSQLIESAISKGNLAHIDVIKNILESNILGPHYVLDGFPRDLAQAMVLQDLINEKRIIEEEKIIIIDLTVPSEIVRKRLMERKLCQGCHAAFSNDITICDFCNNQSFYVRPDDLDINAVERRIQLFYEEKEKMLQFSFKKANYYSVDATCSVEEAHKILLNNIQRA